jgi:phosphatidylglycerophosphate synthase
MSAPLLAAQQKIYYYLRPLRDRLVHPLVVLSVALHLTPTSLSLLGVLAMLAFVVVVPWSLPLALALIILNLLLDATDGALARRLKIDSDKGKVIDITADATAFTLFIIGLIVGELIMPRLGLLLAILMLLSKLLRIWRHSQLLPTNWRFRPVAGFIPTFGAYVLYIAFAVAALTSRNYLPAIATALTLVLALDMLITLFLLHHKKSLLTI